VCALPDPRVLPHCVCVGSTDRLQLEVSELRARLHAASEVEELKKTLERKEKERLQLSFQVEVCVCVWEGETGYFSGSPPPTPPSFIL